MDSRTTQILDGNQAAASVAYRLSQVIAIYPITPASPMGELADEWMSRRVPNIWGSVPSVAEMQSEAGAAGAVHGALMSGAASSTFTASQGLLLMVPNLYKIAGELTPSVIHVAARTVATHALSIFGDHSDVMACRQTGFAVLCSSSVQAAQDLALVAHAATLSSRVPFLHFFDGFRTSHELNRVETLSDDDLRAVIDDADLARHTERGLSPDRPVVRGTAQNPDTFFQAREAANSFYDHCPGRVLDAMQRLFERTGRRYSLFEYTGHPAAERVIVSMGSGAQTVRTVVEALAARGERVGAVEVRLFRPFSVGHFLQALPTSVQSIAVLDRTKEPGAPGEPLYLEVCAALSQRRLLKGETVGPREVPLVIGGRYGLSSKEFTPTMVASVLSELAQPEPKSPFTVGIVDDVTHLSLAPGNPLSVLDNSVFQGVFYGLGSDGTVGANKNSIKILGAETNLSCQGYFVYDSKKAGAVTVSHLRVSERPVVAPYLIERADFVACHQFDFLQRMEPLELLKDGGTFLLNSPYPSGEVWRRLPAHVQARLIEKRAKFYVVDAYEIARSVGLGRRINTVMQVCFFELSKLLPEERFVTAIEKTISDTYSKKGSELVRRNIAAVKAALGALRSVEIPAHVDSTEERPPTVPHEAPDFVKRVTAAILQGRGDQLPVSAFPVDGTWPAATSQWEKRNIATQIPVWNDDICIQCNKCVLMCPHAAIRAKVVEEATLNGAPDGFKAMPFRGGAEAERYVLSVAPEDCTGCRLCVEVCPAKDKANPRRKALELAPQRPRREAEKARYDFFLNLPDRPHEGARLDVKRSQLLRPLFEYSGACPGCGETPYIKLLTQLFGDRLLIANATGCSSIYGGNLPTTPYAVDSEGRGPAWANSLFEDNAEFGFGFRLAIDAHEARVRMLLRSSSSGLGDEFVRALLDAEQGTGEGVAAQRARVQELKERLKSDNSPTAAELVRLADYLVKKTVWLVGGDGWAYDIGYGGLDHVLASRRDVNVLVLDTEVYSNTGGQQSKATPLGAAAKFASMGKSVPKKDLGLLAMSYGHVYVASVAMGARDAQTLRAFVEAAAHPGPSLIIAYSHCIAHGYDMAHGAQQQKLAVDSGVWPLYHFDPGRAERGEKPLVLDGGRQKARVSDYMRNEMRFRMVEKVDKARFETLARAADEDAARRVEIYKQLAALHTPVPHDPLDHIED